MWPEPVWSGLTDRNVNKIISVVALIGSLIDNRSIVMSHSLASIQGIKNTPLEKSMLGNVGERKIKA